MTAPASRIRTTSASVSSAPSAPSGAETTGRAFLDTLLAALPQTPARSSFFDALASPRGLQHLRATNQALVRTMTRTMDDPFAAFP